MKRSYNNAYIILLCISNFISLHASQSNSLEKSKPKANSQKTATTPQKNTPPSNTSAQQKNDSSSAQKAHPILIHATRMLPRKTMNSLHQLIQSLAAYNQNPANQSVINQKDFQDLQKGLTQFAQALGDKHPYLAQEKSQTAASLDESTIMNNIQIILKSLPWYIQNPKSLSSNMNLHDFSQQLNKVYNQIKTEQKKKIQNQIKASKTKSDKKPKNDVRTASLIPEDKDLSDDQKDMREDSDGTPINWSPNSGNDDVIAQSLSNKSIKLAQVLNKRGRIIGSYKRTDRIDDIHIGEFTAIQGKIILVAEGYPQSPKIHGVSKKTIGIVRDPSFAKPEITLYEFHKNAVKKSKK